MELRFVVDEPIMTTDELRSTLWRARCYLQHRANQISARWPRSKRVGELEDEAERLRLLWRKLTDLKIATMK